MRSAEFPAETAVFPKTLAAPELLVLDIPLRLSFEIWMISHIKTNKTPRVCALLTHIADRFARDRARCFFDACRRPVPLEIV